MKKTWRQTFAPDIEKIISENQTATYKELKKILASKNPGPYKWQESQWRVESKAQLNKKFGIVKSEVTKNEAQNKLL